MSDPTLNPSHQISQEDQYTYVLSNLGNKNAQVFSVFTGTNTDSCYKARYAGRICSALSVTKLKPVCNNYLNGDYQEQQ